MWARLFGDFVDTSETFSYQQTCSRALTLEQRVGADRRAVAKGAYTSGSNTAGDKKVDASQDRVRGIIRRRGHFGDRDVARGFIEIHKIRKCPASINGQSVQRHRAFASKSVLTTRAHRRLT